jgi:hypothetical protein
MSSERYSRQSFLGEHADRDIATCVVGVVGLGGGGSHVVQELAHIGFQRYVLYDPQDIDESNLNRLVGGTEDDVRAQRPKVDIASRVIRGLQPNARIDRHQARWQQEPAALRSCDLVFGCVDGFAERRELETTLRRYLVPLIDIGLAVHRVDPQPPQMSGQVILSLPGGPCLKCMGFLTDDVLAAEAAEYGGAGPRPQVVWANGVLASTAVGVAVDLVTGWTEGLSLPVYLLYNANDGTVRPHPRLPYVPRTCAHHELAHVGDPVPVRTRRI